MLEETLLVSNTPVSLWRLGLTPPEAEVLYWIAHGKSNPEIAIILEAALNTVKRHVQNILVSLVSNHAWRRHSRQQTSLVCKIYRSKVIASNPNNQEAKLLAVVCHLADRSSF